MDDSGDSEFDDAPVMTRASFTSGFPSVHPLAKVGVDVGFEDCFFVKQQVFGFCEPVVCCEDYLASILRTNDLSR